MTPRPPHFPVGLRGRAGLWIAGDGRWTPWTGPELGTPVIVEPDVDAVYLERRAGGHALLRVEVIWNGGRLTVNQHALLSDLGTHAWIDDGDVVIRRAAAGRMTGAPLGTEDALWRAMLRGASPRGARRHRHEDTAAALHAVAEAERYPQRRAGVAVMPHLPLRHRVQGAYATTVYATPLGVRPTPDPGEDDLTGTLPPRGGSDVTEGRGVTITTVRGVLGGVAQYLRAGIHIVTVGGGVARAPDGRTRLLTSFAVPFELLLETAMDAGELEARRMIGAAQGETWNVRDVCALIIRATG